MRTTMTHDTRTSLYELVAECRVPAQDWPHEWPARDTPEHICRKILSDYFSME